MRVLVTGATGFLGSHVTRALVAAKHEVVATFRSGSSLWRLADQADSIHWLSFDLTSPDSIAELLCAAKPEVVLHCAAYGMVYGEQSADENIACNILGTQRLLGEAARIGVRRFIHVGSCFEYGNKSYPVSEAELLDPISIYGATKAASTLLLLQQSKVFGLPSVVVRPFGFYGPYDRKDKFVPRVIQACLAGVPMDVTGGEQIRDYTFSSDAVDMFMRLIEAPSFPEGQIMNLASACPVRLREVGELICALMGRRGIVRWGSHPYRPDELMSLTADIGKAHRLLGWQPTVSLTMGLEETIHWHRVTSPVTIRKCTRPTGP